MRPEKSSQILLSITRSKAKMYEFESWVKAFERKWNFGKDEKDHIKVELFIGKLPAGYHAPSILDYRKHPPYSGEEPEQKMANYIEIFIDRTCIWRRTWIGENQGAMNLKELTEDIFMYGMIKSWEEIMKSK